MREKNSVLPVFCKIEHGGGSDASDAGLPREARHPRLGPWLDFKKKKTATAVKEHLWIGRHYGILVCQKYTAATLWCGTTVAVLPDEDLPWRSCMAFWPEKNCKFWTIKFVINWLTWCYSTLKFYKSNQLEDFGVISRSSQNIPRTLKDGPLNDWMILLPIFP